MRPVYVRSDPSTTNMMLSSRNSSSAGSTALELAELVPLRDNSFVVVDCSGASRQSTSEELALLEDGALARFKLAELVPLRDNSFVVVDCSGASRQSTAEEVDVCSKASRQSTSEEMYVLGRAATPTEVARVCS
ncbi:hypothetical protein FACS1894198_7070 [Clostridia bacterium]|nr:hypothetical protein FACS1894198_7070 [Clostridia bacterium]